MVERVSLAKGAVQRSLLGCVVLGVAIGLAGVQEAYARQVDLTVFVGRAFPVADDRLMVRVSAPSLPGLDVEVSGDPAIRVDGGLVVGAALAFELGIVGIEGRVDATDVGFDVTGARYDLRATQPSFAGLAGSVEIGDGRLDANRLYLVSGNLRLRTPGPAGVVVSGGLSLLPDVSITGSVPVIARIAGLPLPGVEPRLRLRLAPGESEHRLGANAGAGLRLGGNRVALMAEVRGFFFREYELRFAVDGAPDLAAALVENLEVVRFRPVIVNLQAGLVFKF
jgi:hypothetical protein